MFEGNDQFIAIVVIVLIIAVGMFAYENLKFIKEIVGIHEDDDDDENEESVLGEIFYLYNNDSPRSWLTWMNKQDHNTRVKAASMLCAHLEGPPKQWGYITIEAIECLGGFKDLLIDHKLAALLHRTSKIWQEYKSIPNYYEKAAEVLATINPDSAIEHFREELENNSGSQSSLEKKRMLINILPTIKAKAKDLMIDILSNQNESFSIKSHALRNNLKFPTQLKNEILLESFTKIVKKHKNITRSFKADELHLIQDLVEDSISMIGQKDFFEIFNEACYIFQFQKLILDSLIRHLQNDTRSPCTLDFYASTLIKDNTQQDLKKSVAKNHLLTGSEISNLVLQPTIKNINKGTLITIPIEESTLPVPEILRIVYDEFKSLFFKNIDNFEVVSSEKIFGAVLLTGTDDIEKIFFTKAMAKEKGWNFGYIDIANIISRETYAETVAIFSKLRKPYLLYIKNPELFFIKGEPAITVFREKFAQTLSIQSLDSKSYLVGDIGVKTEDAEKGDLREALRHLRYKYFPQTMEINKRPHTDKYKIVEKYLQYVNSSRFPDQSELCEKLSEQGKDLNSLEFIFFVIRTLTTMLLVYGRGVPYSDVARLEHQFKLTANKLVPSKNNNNFINENIESDISPEESTAKEDDNIIIAEVQVEQNSGLPARTDYELEN